MPSPARIGWTTMYQRSATWHGNAVNSAMAGRFIQPVCGSVAKGMPFITCGFHPGMCPAASDLPRKQKFGSHSASVSLNSTEYRRRKATW